MNNYRFSVVIPCYNSSKTIARAMESIINQTYKNIELIVVNDGSTDDSERVILDIINKNKQFNIQYKKIPNSGPGKARNTGIDLATGDYISLLDSDDYYDEHLFEEINNINDNFDICYFGWIESYESDNSVISIYSKEYHFLDKPTPGLEVAKLKYKSWLWLCNCNEVYSLKMINEFHLRYPENVYVGEDTAFIYKCIGHAKTVVSLPKDYFYNKAQKDSLLHREFNEKYLSLFNVTKELFDYCSINFNEEFASMINSLYVYSQVIVAKKISESYKFYNFIKFSRAIKKYIPKIKNNKKLVLSKKRKIELNVYKFSKPLFLLIYKMVKK